MGAAHLSQSKVIIMRLVEDWTGDGMIHTVFIEYMNEQMSDEWINLDYWIFEWMNDWMNELSEMFYCW